jgi:hypothetical protein
MRVKTVKILYINNTEYSTRLSVSGLFFYSLIATDWVTCGC